MIIESNFAPLPLDKKTWLNYPKNINNEALIKEDRSKDRVSESGMVKADVYQDMIGTFGVLAN